MALSFFHLIASGNNPEDALNTWLKASYSPKHEPHVTRICLTAEQQSAIETARAAFRKAADGLLFIFGPSEATVVLDEFMTLRPDAANPNAPVGFSTLNRVVPINRKTNTSPATDSDQSTPMVAGADAGLPPMDHGKGIIHRMTAENERSDQSDAHKHSLAKQRQPGMIRALFVPSPTRCYPGECRHEDRGERDPQQCRRAQPDDPHEDVLNVFVTRHAIRCWR